MKLTIISLFCLFLSGTISAIIGIILAERANKLDRLKTKQIFKRRS